ncbi:MAG: penicillin-binding protein 2 [Actinobacteria bacterium]|nr:penicillin-binding protein 2 [Actinomycetota bacterium]
MRIESFRTPRGTDLNGTPVKRTALLILATLLVAGAVSACTSTEGTDPLPSTARAADEFIDALGKMDHETLSSLFTESASAEWPAEKLRRWLKQRLDEGLIDEIVVHRSATPPQPARVETEEDELAPAYEAVPVKYEVLYNSGATPETVSLSGIFELSLDDEGERWLVEWSPELLWPGVDGATQFGVLTKWSKRAPIKDRDGRVLAKGDAAKRTYPFGTLAGSTIGHIETVTKKEATEDLEEGALVGGSGLEAAFNEQLSGTPTVHLAIVDGDGKPIERYPPVPGIPGETLRTTLDVEVQQRAEAAYPPDEVGGAVVIQPATGDVLAVVDSSEFGPGNYVGATGVAPFNRPLVGRYPPGSTMKVIPTSAALDTGLMTPQTTLSGPAEYKGVRNFESSAYASLSLADAVKFSVNTAIAQVAERLGEKRLTKYAERFGFNQEPRNLLLVAESQFPPPAGSLSDLMWSSIGQAQVLATPLQMASVAATIANDGVRMEPRFSLDERKRGTRVISRQTAAEVTAMMEAVVQGGTGTNAQIAGVSVAGKTGTAEVDVAGKRQNHAWFISFAPSSAPRIAVAVVSEYGGVGGQVAAPIARQIYLGVLPVAP